MIMLTNQKIHSVINLKFNKEDVSFQKLALANSDIPETLTFLDDTKFISQINNNSNITGVITTEALAEKLDGKEVLISDCPRFDFFTLMNVISKEEYKKEDSQISETAFIYRTAYVSDYNVKIGKNTIIEPNVTIFADVEIGDNCIIRAGAVVGSEGFEVKRTEKGVLTVFHDGKVILGNNVEVGANTAIDKGFSFRNTIIEDDAKIDNLVHVAHGVTIRKRALVVAGTVLGGSSIIGEDAWTSINASIAPAVEVKSKGFVSMGAVVTKNVEEGQQVTGNLAIDHHKFMTIFKNNLRNNS
ncbi:UDP-3-O-(3-hydroxymyristoyl) glucosamine N-acyltransferase [Chryseobacterium sp. HMWF028]|nr:UDP-3-O-(3-hydroxymyristoyl) glucosamine N-acyltransferase [Chryseobacterium sp. HMWF028]